MLQEFGPEKVEETDALPTLHSPMNGAVVAELFGQLIPLAARSHSVDDAIEGFASIDAFAARPSRRIMLLQERLQNAPEVVGYVPDGWKGFWLLVGCQLGGGHRWLLRGFPPFFRSVNALLR